MASKTKIARMASGLVAALALLGSSSLPACGEDDFCAQACEQLTACDFYTSQSSCESACPDSVDEDCVECLESYQCSTISTTTTCNNACDWHGEW